MGVLDLSIPKAPKMQDSEQLPKDEFCWLSCFVADSQRRITMSQLSVAPNGLQILPEQAS